MEHNESEAMAAENDQLDREEPARNRLRLRAVFAIFEVVPVEHRRSQDETRIVEMEPSPSGQWRAA